MCVVVGCRSQREVQLWSWEFQCVVVVTLVGSCVVSGHSYSWTYFMKFNRPTLFMGKYCNVTASFPVLGQGESRFFA